MPIVSERDIVARLTPLSENDIFDFMQRLRGGTYFNMGMYSCIPVSRAYKNSFRIYKVVNMTAIVSGVSYENIGTTKDFRDRTGDGPGHAWYDHVAGFENKIAAKKSDPNSKYVLWDIKEGSNNWVRYYLVDLDNDTVTPVSKDQVKNSGFLTASEKAKLEPKKVEGFDKTTGDLVQNATNWRTTSFDHIFWLSQAGTEYGVRFTESVEGPEGAKAENLTEASGELFRDAHAHANTDLDAILSGDMEESLVESRGDFFRDAHAGVKTDLDGILSGGMDESFEEPLTEAFRRTVSRGRSLVDNELFVDFD